MNLNSIRWRLPFSYAAIALLAALALGSVMLLVLNGYYAEQERNYLMGNAISLSPIIEKLLSDEPGGPTVQDQVNGLAFLSQTRIRVMDPAGKVLADSGVPESGKMVSVEGAPAGQVLFTMGGSSRAMPVGTVPGGTVPGGTQPAVAIFERQVFGTPDATMPIEVGVTGVARPDTRRDTVFFLSASPYGYGFVSSTVAFSGQRSSQVVAHPMTGALGTVELSAGPSYGTDILNAVSLAWLVASIIAILLAALAGWFASRDVTRPVLALTDATRRMEQGDLGMRANLPGTRQANEFQTLADSFNNMAQRVENTVSTLRSFVSDAAHEINTPLTALKTNLELAANETDAAQRDIFLARALEQNRRLELLTGGLLDLSRIEAAQPAPEPVSLRQLAAETGERFASRAEQAERSFGLYLPESDLIVSGSTLQLQRALDNLLENALKFTPPGGTIQLTLEEKDGQVILTVTDNGIGILPEDLPHLFERFHRGRNSAEYPGNGLGLAIVKAIVSAHGGHVSVESAGRGEGSRFTVVVPKNS